MKLQKNVRKYEFRTGYRPYFYSGENNFLAIRALTAANYHNPMILCGPSGVGKSHLTNGILGDYALAHNKTLKTVSAIDLIDQILADLKHQKSMLDVYANADILVIDDGFALRGKSATQEYIFDIIYDRVKNNRVSVLIVEELSQLDPTFWGLFRQLDCSSIVEMSYPSDEIKEAYAEYRADLLHLGCKADDVRHLISDAKTVVQINANLMVLQNQNTIQEKR